MINSKIFSNVLFIFQIILLCHSFTIKLPKIPGVINQKKHPINDRKYQERCKQRLDNDGVLTLPNFLTANALQILIQEAKDGMKGAYYCQTDHNVYLTTTKDDNNHITAGDNRLVRSSKGCICDDQIAHDSVLRILYDSPEFRSFVVAVTSSSSTSCEPHSTHQDNKNTPRLYSYADPLSSINIHYAHHGQELGWHFDNSEFAITLLIQKPEKGSRFEFVKDIRQPDLEVEINTNISNLSTPSSWTKNTNPVTSSSSQSQVTQLLDGKIKPTILQMNPGMLVLFRGRNSIHRVSPNECNTTRMLAVLAYNTEPDIALSESARKTFYGRLG